MQATPSWSPYAPSSRGSPRKAAPWWSDARTGARSVARAKPPSPGLEGVGQADGLVALRADREDRDRHAHQRGQPLEVGARVGGQIGERASAAERLAPARELLVAGGHPRPRALGRGGQLEATPPQLVGRA